MDKWYKTLRGMGTYFLVKEHHIKDPKITKPITKPSPHHSEKEN